ncbi:MAG: radical SAM/SPASM domain-containing protein [Candidatus Omnitrophota bacterium]
MKRIKDKLYDIVVYNRSIKRMVVAFFKTPIIVNNPAYNFIYGRLLKKKMELFNDIPFRVMIENTNNCNANCVFCPHKNMKRESGTMELALTRRIIDECANFGITYLTIYGFGEPLLDKYFFERVRYAKSKKIDRVTTNTNAMYLNKNIAKEFIDSGIDEVYISFDAATADTFKMIRPNLNFDTVKQNILGLIEEKKRRKISKLKVFLSFVEGNHNMHERDAYIKEWKNKVDGVSVSLIHNWTGSIKKMDKELSCLRRDPCRLLWTDMVVSWNGDVPLCCNDFDNRIILGNVTCSSIKEIWSGEKLKKIRQSHLNKEFSAIAVCKECEYNLHFKSPWWISK